MKTALIIAALCSSIALGQEPPAPSFRQLAACRVPNEPVKCREAAAETLQREAAQASSAMRVVALGSERDVIVVADPGLQNPEVRASALSSAGRTLFCEVGFRKIRFVWSDLTNLQGGEERNLDCAPAPATPEPTASSPTKAGTLQEAKNQNAGAPERKYPTANELPADLTPTPAAVPDPTRNTTTNGPPETKFWKAELKRLAKVQKADIKRLKKLQGRADRDATAVQNVCAAHPGWTEQTCWYVAHHQLAIGMTMDQVKAAWGNPGDLLSNGVVSRTYVQGHASETWLYDHLLYKRMLLFEDGILVAAQDY